jgi:DNA-binding GntR family transcriptional regulator
VRVDSGGRTAWGSYARIADALRQRLTAGNPPPGALMPSEAALCQEYGVVRNTVRRALAALEAEGLIETLPGRGRIVRPPGQPPASTGGTPPQYRRIATELRTAIEHGDLQPGDALPSEAALMATYGVSRGTARQALADLEGAGLIDSHHGRGRYVRQP